MLVGDRAYEALFKSKEESENTFSEFKRTMGEDKLYYSSHTDRKYTSEELSAEVLKQLKLAVKDEEFSSVVITVPADFDQVQIEATRRAANIAGFQYCELLQEPIAASLAFLSDQKISQGMWLVFDFGGGTFDAALVRMEDGIMKVVDHAGDNHLGGKNMDWLLVDEVILPRLTQDFQIDNIINDEKTLMEFRKTWKPYAERAKIDLSDQDSCILELDDPRWQDRTGKLIDLPIKIDRLSLEALIEPLIDRAIGISKELISKAGVQCSDLQTVLMIGGPTYMPLLRTKVKKEICDRIDVKIDPMTAVARGAALFASTKAIPKVVKKQDRSKIQLTLAYPSTTVESEVSLGIKVEGAVDRAAISSGLWVQITRGDSGWATGKIQLKNGVGVVRLHLNANSSNAFALEMLDSSGNRLECEPNTLTIMQGIKIAQPPLPHDIGISAIVKGSDNEEELVPILKKGTPLPAVDKRSFVIPKNIRPGNKSDILKIIVWEGIGGTRPVRNVHMGEIVISGDKLSSLLPEGSKAEVTIRMDESRRATKVSVFIPYLDETIEGVMDIDYKLTEITSDELSVQIDAERDRFYELQQKLEELNNQNKVDLDEYDRMLDDLDNLNEKGLGDRDRCREVQKRLNQLAVKMDEIERNIKWPQIVKDVEDELTRTKNVVERFGAEKDEKILEKLRVELNKVMELRNPKRTEEALAKVAQLKYGILFSQPGYWVSILQNINEHYDEIKWNNRAEARSLLNRGGEILATGQFSDEIKKIVVSLWNLMPESDQERSKIPRTDILHY
jgi:molecular chaperone DnaK